MTAGDIIRQRLLNQRIAETTFTKPEQVVSYFSAVQAQEYAVSKWAIGLRANGLVDDDVEKAVNDGKILRTHALRPTWHFVTPADIRWMLMLNKPRVLASMKARWKELDLNDKIVSRSNNILAKALEGKQLTRKALKELLQKQKIKTDESRLSHLLMAAELDALICSGPREGKHFTYALLDERVTATKPALSLSNVALTKDEALYKLAERYFTSRGPATIQDFATWSGLAMADIRKSVEMLPKKFVREIVVDKEYIFIPNDDKIKDKSRGTFLMPDYDEYGIGYKDRSEMNPHGVVSVTREGSFVFSRMIVVDGVLAGGWKKMETKNGIEVEVIPTIPLNKSQQQSLQKAVNRYKDFIGVI